MKIYLLGPANPYRGGIAKFDEVLASRFAGEGNQVKIVNFTLQYPSFLFPGKSQYTAAPAPSGLSIDRLVNSVNPLNWYRVGGLIARERPDLLIVRYWMPFFAPSLGTVARRVRRNGHTRVIALADNIVPHERRVGDGPLTRFFLRSIDGVIYMSDEVGRDLDSFRFAGESALSPHPIYDTYGPPLDRAEACRMLELDPAFGYVLFFGFIRDYKGLDLLLEAWAMLKERGETAGKKLLIAGEYYGNQAKYEALIHSLGLSDELVMHDRYIDEGEVGRYFSVADLVVQPYRTATQSGVTQVAYHFGVPMVVTNVGGLAEIVPDGKVGYVVERDPAEIAGAIGRFYREERAADFRQNIETEKKRFGWDRLTAAFGDMYRRLKEKQ